MKIPVLSFVWWAIVELFVCVPFGHKWKFDLIGVACCRRCKREGIEGVGKMPRGWRP
jgi:hypothetical protein